MGVPFCWSDNNRFFFFFGVVQHGKDYEGTMVSPF